DNGIKWILRGEPPSPEMIQQVGEFAQTYVPTHTISLLELSTPQFNSEFCKKYQQAIFNDIQLKRPLKVVLDGLHGSAGHCSKLVLEKMGCEVIALR
ncbi:phosphomannomutase/phosphoglucomutase, partial [Acinetobacter baumannii]